MPTAVTMPPSIEAWKWLPRTSLSTVLMQRSTVRSSSCFCVSEGDGRKGIVLKDFLSSGEGPGGSAAATIGELRTKKIDAEIMANFPDSMTTPTEKQRAPGLSSCIGNPGLLQPTVRDCCVNRRSTVNLYRLLRGRMACESRLSRASRGPMIHATY